MKRKQVLEDAVEGAKEGILLEDAEFDSLDVSKIKVEVLPEDAAKAIHPFHGYPVQKVEIPMKETDRATGKKVMVPKKFNITEWVLHNHIADPVHQDKSNRNRRTYHSRSILDILSGNSAPNIIMQFSTRIKTATGEFYGSLVPDPYIRAQLIFTRDKKSGRIMVDKRYMLLDPEQKNRLKQCYFQLIKPQLDMEKAADQITAGEEPTNIREVEYGTTEL